MNVNIVDISHIIEQVRKEERQKTLLELQSLLIERELPSKRVTAYIKDSLESLGINSVRHYQLQNAISVIVRHTLGLERLSQLKTKQMETAIMVVDDLMGTILANLEFSKMYGI